MTDPAPPAADVAPALAFEGLGYAYRPGSVPGVLQPPEGRVAFVPQMFNLAFGYNAPDMVLMGRAQHVGLFSQPPAQQPDPCHRPPISRGGTRPRSHTASQIDEQALAFRANMPHRAARCLWMHTPSRAPEWAQRGARSGRDW